MVPNRSCKQLQTVLTRFVKFLWSATSEGWIKILQLKFKRRHNVVVWWKQFVVRLFVAAHTLRKWLLYVIPLRDGSKITFASL